MLRTPRTRLRLGVAALILITPLVTAAASTAQPAAAQANAAVPSVNWALDGSATATTAESGYPASNAIDGDAGTDWCTSGWTGTLTVDLGQVRTLADLGITLDSASPSASASIELAPVAGDWRQPPTLRDLALDPGSPMYVPLPDGTSARYAELTVYSDTGADVCVGEFRGYGPDPAASGLDLGADLSFTPQELAAGATFTDEGNPGTPVTVLRLLGRPHQAEHPGRVAGRGPGPAHRHRDLLHPPGHLRVRAAGHAGRHGLHRQRDQERDPVAGR
jgi:F5/8 type C domain